MNLKKVRDTLNKFNDTFHHLNYLPIEIPPTDHSTYQIINWIIFGSVLFILTLTFIRYLVSKNNKIIIIINPKEDKIANELVVLSNSNKTELLSKTEVSLKETSDLDDILYLD